MSEIGWRFEVRNSAGLTQTIGFTATGEFSFDATRDVPKNITGFTLIPQEQDKVDLELDQVLAYIVIDGEEFSMGTFNFTEDIRQKAVVKARVPGGDAEDLIMVSLSDETMRLNRNDGSAETLYQGFDPASSMREMLGTTGIPFQVAGSPNLAGNSVTWDGSTKMLEKLRQLGELSGHRPLWMDRFGVIRSVSALQLLDDPINLTDLQPEYGSITVTNNYLTAPNRIIVADNSGADYQIVGQWDAPGSAPHSALKRGYITAEIVSVQGLESVDHANRVAKTIGESYTARKLTANIIPTYRLDGPVAISYDDITWLVNSWSVSTAPGSMMSMEATEYIEGT